MVIFGPFMVKMYWNNILNSFIDFAASFWCNKKSHFIILEAQNPHVHDFGICGRVQSPQNQHYLSLERPGHLNNIKKISGTFLKFIIL